MDSRAIRMVGDSQNIIGIGITGNLPGPLDVAFAVTVSADVLRVLVGSSIDNNVVKAEVPAGLHNPYGDFASVCYEDFIVHNQGLLICFA